ncbi:MAG: AsmA family protein [Nitrospirota bacterium]|nr:AsmA family protein [Nitrospirota bacterium]MDH5767586.1 AsmA family protein [Nitrospirota bacterium]
MALNLKKIFTIASTVVIILFFIFVYFGYLNVKKTFITKISDKATSSIGQKVTIGDLSFNLATGINFYNVCIENPADFESGHLVQIEKLYLNMKFSELLKGKIYFKNIIIYSPEFTLLKDREGRLNISEKLILLLTEKSEAKHQVDELTITSGIVDFDKDERYRFDDLNLHLKDLSSSPNTKTLVQGHTVYAGKNRMKMDGWVYLNDEPKKFALSLSSENFALSAFKKLLDRYKINTDKTKLNIHITAGGDSEKGVSLKSTMQIKDAGSSFFNKEVQNILFTTDAFLKIKESSLVILVINDMSLASGDVLAIHSKGIITDIVKNPSYSAELSINRMDISAFNLMKDLKVSGIVTSNNIHARGTFKKAMPEISGTLQVKDAAMKSPDVDVEKINANFELSSDREMTVKAEATAKILKAGGYILDKPADISFSVNAKGKPERIDVTSSFNLSPFEMQVKGNKAACSDSISFNIDGSIKDTAFSGRNFFKIKGIKYGDYNIPWLNGNFKIDYTKNTVAVKDLRLKTEGFASSAGQIKIKIFEGKARYSMDSKDVNISYPEKQIELNNFDLYADVHTGREKISGTIDFSIGKGKVQGITSGSISGTGNFDEKDFSVDIPRAEISGGKIKLALKGRTSEGPFPLIGNASAENIDMGDISRAISKFSEIPYRIAGNIKSATFEGTVISMDSLKGNAFVTARKLSVVNEETKRNILKEGFLDSEMTFKGNVLEFKADTGTGNVSTGISGMVERFMKKDRSIKIKAHLPEVKAADIRNSFWDIFPDGLLYTGLEGSLSSDVFIDYENNKLKINGKLMLKDFTLKGENNEYSIGPVNGVVPIIYNEADDQQKPYQTTPFERSEFENLHKYYSQKTVGGNLTKVTIGALSYGFKFLEDITLWMSQDGNILNIEHFNGNISGGRFYGSALVDSAHGVNYRAGIILKGLSLTQLCENIGPIKGYISGKVDGIIQVKGSGMDIAQLIGKADFWTYSAENEKTKISRGFLQKIGGPSLKTYLGDRNFDKGIMSVYLQAGFIIFRELEISNRNIFGITDLSVKVAPFNNRIAIDHLMWTITEAAQRAQEKQ